MATTDPRDEDGDRLRRWRELLEAVAAGKVVGGARYVHVSAVPVEALALIGAEAASAGAPGDGYNVLKLALDAPKVSLLHYPDFFDRAFPLLSEAWTVDLAAGRCEHRAYEPGRNPPVLHRKELLLRADDPRRTVFEALTAEAERHDLFAKPLVIGHRKQWEEIVRAKGLRVEGHSLVPLEAPVAAESAEVLRHRTAMARRALSTPMQALWRHGYLAAALSVFDYGCGRGDDLAALAAGGVAAEGWDPYYRPDAPRSEADVVNLGFVLNVIEDPSERREALTRAYGLTRKVLAVSAILGGRTASEQFRAYGDGVLTQRNTFQKYFRHEELGEYVAAALGREPVSVGPGLYFVFRRDEDEQDFLEERQRSSGRFGAMPVRPAVERAPREPRAPRVKAPTRWERHAELVEAFWAGCLALGRAPREGEFARLGELTRDVASAAVVLRRLTEQRGAEELERARARRMGDLSVFFALNLFERRRSASALGERAKADVREFFGSHAKAAEAGQRLLFSLREPRTVERACEEAAAQGLGWLVAGESLQLDGRLVNELPPALRVYVGCAGRLYGEVQGAEVVKIHVSSGKVSLMRYDDYEGSAVPMLVERVKVDLRRQQVTYYEYGGEYETQPLWLKSRYLHPAMEGYEGQRAFDEVLLAKEGVDWSGYGPGLAAMAGVLEGVEAPDGLRVTGARRGTG